jgi:hypothetical protein
LLAALLAALLTVSDALTNDDVLKGTLLDGRFTFSDVFGFGPVLFGSLNILLAFILLDETNDYTNIFYKLVSSYKNRKGRLDTVFYRTISSSLVDVISLLRRAAHATHIAAIR